ncbi:MAG: hypothetical protein ACT4OZ_07500 [Gemmatimonadota bacterium]
MVFKVTDLAGQAALKKGKGKGKCGKKTDCAKKSCPNPSCGQQSCKRTTCVRTTPGPSQCAPGSTLAKECKTAKAAQDSLDVLVQQVNALVGASKSTKKTAAKKR